MARLLLALAWRLTFWDGRRLKLGVRNVGRRRSRTLVSRSVYVRIMIILRIGVRCRFVGKLIMLTGVVNRRPFEPPVL